MCWARDGNQVTKKSEEELREVFHKVDEDGSGALERDELSLLAKVSKPDRLHHSFTHREMIDGRAARGYALSVCISSVMRASKM